MRRVFVDTNVFVYAVGEPHPYREPCRAIIGRLERGELAGESSVEVASEAAHVRLRRTGDPRGASQLARSIATICQAHTFEPRDLLFALDLLVEHAPLPVRDAIHSAMALNRGIEAVLSADRDFDAVDGLERIDPTDVEALDALAGVRP